MDFTEANNGEWQWHQLGHMQVCTSLQTDNHTSTPPLSFLQAGCPSCRPTNSVKALKARLVYNSVGSNVVPATRGRRRGRHAEAVVCLSSVESRQQVRPVVVMLHVDDDVGLN